MNVDTAFTKFMEQTQRATERFSRAREVLMGGELDTEIATTPSEVVYTEDRIQLKHYKPDGASRLKTPLLIVYALINRHTVLDLQPGRSVIQNLLGQGIEFYMIDWGYPTRKDRYLTIGDHVCGYVDNVVDFIRERHGSDQVNLFGVCMGGTFCTIYSALYPEKVKNLVTTVTPSNFDTDEGLLHMWMQKMDVDRMVATFGNMPGDLLNVGFLLLNPARLMIDKYLGFLEKMDDQKFVEGFVRMEKWIFDSPDVPGETFKQFIEDCYHNNLLMQNRMEVEGQTVNLQNVTMPLLNIYGQFDHLVPPAACDKLTSAVGSKDTEDICLKTGHIGIYVSSKTQAALVPKVAEWLESRDGAKPAKSAKASASKAKKSSGSKSKSTSKSKSKS
jgi:polyhydroxyalkanoate synthase